MTALQDLYQDTLGRLKALDGILPILARILFAAILLRYFWQSGMTKLGDGFWGFMNLDWDSVYVQIFPRAFAAVGYDSTQMNSFHTLISVLGTWAEFILPLLVVIGLFTRLASLGMIGFIFVQSLTDLYGHGAIHHEEQVGVNVLPDGTNEPIFGNPTLGAWFDAIPLHELMDIRSLWVFLLLLLVIKGPGLISIDRGIKLEDPNRID